jgi:putative ABC transport system ATP-binding protein
MRFQSINQGEFSNYYGTKWGGKSTLLNIGLLDSATSGSYQLLNQEMMGKRTRKERVKDKENKMWFLYSKISTLLMNFRFMTISIAFNLQ